jgi:hypothetical protein
MQIVDHLEDLQGLAFFDPPPPIAGLLSKGQAGDNDRGSELPRSLPSFLGLLLLTIHKAAAPV